MNENTNDSRVTAREHQALRARNTMTLQESSAIREIQALRVGVVHERIAISSDIREVQAISVERERQRLHGGSLRYREVQAIRARRDQEGKAK